MALTYEQLEPVFRKVIPRYCNWRYDYWELVAEVWLMGNVQRLKDIRLAYRRVVYDVIVYMRTQEGRAGTKNSPKRPAVLQSYDELMRSDKPDATILDKLSDEQKSIRTLDNAEEIEFLFKGLTREQRMCLQMEYAGFKQYEIAAFVPSDPSWVSIQKTRSLNHIRERIEQYAYAS